MIIDHMLEGRVGLALGVYDIGFADRDPAFQNSRSKALGAFEIVSKVVVDEVSHQVFWVGVDYPPP